MTGSEITAFITMGALMALGALGVVILFWIIINLAWAFIMALIALFTEG